MPFQIALAHHSEDALKILRQILAPQPDYVLAWTASTGPETQRKCRLGAPDMLLVDLALAGPDGARLVCDIMHASPCAVLILSDAIAKNAGKVFDAMGCGALDAIATPVLNKSGSVAGADALLKKLATIAKLLGNAAPSAPRTPSRASREADRLPPLVAIGSSTGGPKALATILAVLPGDLPAALVVCQHVDLQFAQGLAQWLDSQTQLTVTLAREGMRPRPGVVLVAGTNDHIVLGPDRTVRYTTHPREYPYRPSVNTFFESLREHWPGKDLAVLLTGMGRDGAEGLASLRKAGWHTIVQDEKTSIVYGMPAAAAELGAAAEILPLDRIADAILKKLPTPQGKKV